MKCISDEEHKHKLKIETVSVKEFETIKKSPPLAGGGLGEGELYKKNGRHSTLAF